MSELRLHEEDLDDDRPRVTTLRRMISLARGQIQAEGLDGDQVYAIAIVLQELWDVPCEALINELTAVGYPWGPLIDRTRE